MTSLYDKLKSIQDAINYEIDQHYINAKGKKTTFSNFIIQNTKMLSPEIEDKSQLKTLMNLFYGYPTQDVSSRIEAIHTAQQILKEISVENKKNITKLKLYEKDLNKIDVQYVKGVGPKIARILNKIGVISVCDLFNYYPRTYINYERQVLIKDLKIDDEVTILGSVKSIKIFSPSRKKNLMVIIITLADDSGKITITRFTNSKLGRIMEEQYKKQYPIGSKAVCSGTVSFDKFSRSFSLANASIEPLNNNESLNTGRIVPVYALTEGLSLEYLRKIVSNALNSYLGLTKETLPKQILLEEKLLDLKAALSQIHFPDSQELYNLAHYRIVFEEFFTMQLKLAYRRHIIEKNKSGLSLQDSKDSLVTQLIKSLPFELTNAQKKVFLEIKKDLMSPKPMHRLLQGDVGSGKTIVALMALLFAIENGYQTALMAPTEILVEQHLRKFQEYLNPLGIQVFSLTGNTPNKAKKEIYRMLATNEIKIIVGTHALIQDEVQFAKLGLVIIDEQHRFGVKQRDILLKKGKNVERLFMTATPIPRTLALALHGDLELSEIDELPPGRIAVRTSIVQPWQRSKAYDLIRGEVAKGRQAYIVFPLIEESEALSAKAATIEFEELSKTIFKDLKLGLMHGELPPSQKELVMQNFINKTTHILVTTTVIEVGVDVQNATVMMIENSERFGLSQLHQLRGRVGRGTDQSYCLLSVQNYSEEAFQRLSILTKTNDGFIISQEDLKIRGPGEFLGTKQSGLPDLHLADLVKDVEILEKARERSIEVIQQDPTLGSHLELKELISERNESYITAG